LKKPSSATKAVRPKASILLSGGIDSSACVSFYLESGFDVDALFIDYGQLSARQERKAASQIASHYSIPHSIVSLKSPRSKGPGLILGRNAFLLFTALLEVPLEPQLICIGIHAGTSYPDCHSAFLKKIQTIFDLYSSGIIQIGAPFLWLGKKDIWLYCKSHNVPIALTYSCERGARQPCGKCASCMDLEALYAL